MSRVGGSRVVHSFDCRFARSRNLPMGAALPPSVYTESAAALARARRTRIGDIDRARRSDMMTGDPNPHHGDHFNCHIDWTSSEETNPLMLRYERPLETFSIFDSADAAVESLFKTDTSTRPPTRSLPWLAKKLLEGAAVYDVPLARAYDELSF